MVVKKKKGKTVAQLRAECKRLGIKGYSGLRKAELKKKCTAKKASKKAAAKAKPKKDKTVAQLRAECKRLGIKGYSGLRKAELKKKCAAKKASKKRVSSKASQDVYKKVFLRFDRGGHLIEIG